MDPSIRLLRELVAIDSVNPTLVPGAAGEGEIAAVLAAEMRSFGLDVEMQDVAPGRPNVVGVLDGRAPGRTLMWCGHTDTVGVTGMTAPFVPVEKGGRLYGRGAQDMKGGVAAMVAAARAIVEQGGLASGRIVIAAVVDEEHLSAGAEALVTRWRADAAVVTEPTDLALAIGHKGFAWVEIEVLGKAAHGSRPRDGQDAILRLGRVLAQLEALDVRIQARPPHALMGAGSLHASIIAGGHELSSYPDRAVLQMERRTLPGEPVSTALDEVRAILDALTHDDPSFRATAASVFGRPAYELPADHALPRTLAAAIAAAGGTPQIVGASFWTDAAVLGHAGIPSVLFGPGGAGLHSTEEYVNVADVAFCRDVLVDLARRFC
ncbi:MAG TPA: ArgE/DapE family deacylase [Vicinamibacterales bacterium]|jgi:acetylornithine deacetylase|nr:ArgE/DapE family deacylase [Vicinamibacterales bacterium]